jgi:hypothetical protein
MAAIQTLLPRAEANVHQLKVETKYGAHETCRVYGFPDRDMAALAALEVIYHGGTVKSAELLAAPGEIEPPLQHAEWRLPEIQFRGFLNMEAGGPFPLGVEDI